MEEILRVGGGTSATALGSTIAHQIYATGKCPPLRAIGAGAINQAMKAIAIASGYVAPKGLVLLTRPAFADVEMPDEEMVTALILYIITESP